MYRILLFVVLSFTAGLLLTPLFPHGWHPLWILLPAGVAVWFVKKGRMFSMLMLALFAGMFYGVSYERGHQPTLDGMVGRQVHLRGQVDDDPSVLPAGGRLRFQLTEIQVNGTWTEVDEAALVKMQPAAGRSSSALRYGDQLEVAGVRLDKLEPARNPGGFDAASYYGRQGILYSMSVKPQQVHVIGHDDGGVKGRLLLPVRHRLLEVLRTEFPDQQSAVLAGLVLGVTAGIDPDVMQSFRTLGVVHILAVSGANVALLLVPLLRVLEWCKLSARKRYAVGILVVLLFTGIADGGASVTRAGVTAVLWCLARMVSRESDTLTSWALAGWLTVLFDPPVLHDLGFQLTYLVTIGLLLIPERMISLLSRLFPVVASRIPGKLFAALVTAFVAEAVSVPLILTVNPSFTPLSLLANLYILPLVAVLVPCALLALVLGLVHPILAFLPVHVAKFLLACLVDPLTYVGSAKWCVRNYSSPATWWVWGYYGGWLLFIVRRLEAVPLYVLLRKWILGGIACLLAGALVMQSYGTKELRVTFLDVGQGDSSLIEMPQGTVWLVDGGGIPGFQHSAFDVGQKIVVPALASKGIDDIDVMVMTHADEDHVRGLLAVLQNFRVHRVVVSDLKTDKAFYQELLQEVRKQGIPISLAQAGMSWTPEVGVTVTFWNPPANHYAGTRSDTNSNSAVFSLSYGDRSFLFTADVEEDAEAKMPLHQHVDVLKVAHHGSGYSTSAAFLHKVTPEVAVVSVGAQNRYGHPAPRTLERLREAQADIWRTDQMGAIVCETDGEQLQVRSWLKQH